MPDDALGLADAGLFEPVQQRMRLPALRKSLVTRRMQADIVEALIGATCLAKLEAEPPGAPGRLDRGLDAAKRFFDTYVHPQEEDAPAEDDGRSSAWSDAGDTVWDRLADGVWSEISAPRACFGAKPSDT